MTAQTTDGAGLNPSILSDNALSEEQVKEPSQEQLEQGEAVRSAPVGLPPETWLRRHVDEISASHSAVAVVKDPDLKMYHGMSVKQSLKEGLAEHSYQFSRRPSDWPCMSFAPQVPMHFEPVELHVIDALGQQDVPEYFQQPAKAISPKCQCYERSAGSGLDSSNSGRNCFF